MYFARCRETLLFLIDIFFSWRIFECKKLLCQNSCTSFETLFVRVQKWVFSSIWSSRVARIFFLRSGDGVIDCEKVEVVWRERKGYNAKQHVTICLRVLRRIDGADLMEGKKGGLWALPRFTVPSGFVAWLSCQIAVAWLISFLWDT